MHSKTPQLLALLLLTACPAENDVLPSDTAREVYTLRFAHGAPTDSTQHLAAQHLAQRLATITDGQVQLTVHPNHQLGPDHEILASVRAGDLAFALLPTARLSRLVPGMRALDIPFLFSDRSDCHRVVDGPPGRTLLEALRPHGLVGAAIWDGGFLHVAATRALRTPKDHQGLRVAVRRSPILIDHFRALGATPIPMDLASTQSALHNAALDGQELQLELLANSAVRKAQRYLMLTGHGVHTDVLVVSSKILESLPGALRDSVIDAGRLSVAFHRATQKGREEQRLTHIRKSGIEVIAFTPEALRALSAGSERVLEINRRVIGTEILESVLQTLTEGRPTTDSQIVIGLDADLQGHSALSGASIKRGAMLAINEINQHGGLLGKELVLRSRDNSMVSARGIANVQKFAKIRQLVAIIGGISSPVALAELELLHSEKILYLDPWAAATAIVDNGFTPNYAFRVSVRDADAGDFLVGRALSSHKRIALLLSNNGWGRSNEHAMVAALRRRNLKPATVQWFQWGERDFDTILSRIEESGAEMIIYVGPPLEGAAFVRRMSHRKKILPFISHWGITGGHFHAEAADALRRVDLRVLQTASFMNARPQGKMSALADRYLQAYGGTGPESIFAPTGTAHAYDLVHLLAKAISRAGTTDRAKVRDALESLPIHHGVMKSYRPPFTATRHDALDATNFTLARYRSDGVLVPTEP